MHTRFPIAIRRQPRKIEQDGPIDGDITMSKPKPKTYQRFLPFMGNWVEITTKLGKKRRGRLITINSIRQTITLHSDKTCIIKFKNVATVKSICKGFEVPVWYKRKLIKGKISKKRKRKQKGWF